MGAKTSDVTPNLGWVFWRWIYHPPTDQLYVHKSYWPHVDIAEEAGLTEYDWFGGSYFVKKGTIGLGAYSPLGWQGTSADLLKIKEMVLRRIEAGDYTQIGSHEKEAAGPIDPVYTLLYTPAEVRDRFDQTTKPSYKYTAFARINGRFFYGMNHPYMTEAIIKNGIFSWEQLFDPKTDQHWGYLSEGTAESDWKITAGLFSGTKGHQDQSMLGELAAQMEKEIGIPIVPKPGFMGKKTNYHYWRKR